MKQPNVSQTFVTVYILPWEEVKVYHRSPEVDLSKEDEFYGLDEITVNISNSLPGQLDDPRTIVFLGKDLKLLVIVTEKTPNMF